MFVRVNFLIVLHSLKLFRLISSRIIVKNIPCLVANINKIIL